MELFLNLNKNISFIYYKLNLDWNALIALGTWAGVFATFYFLIRQIKISENQNKIIQKQVEIEQELLEIENERRDKEKFEDFANTFKKFQESFSKKFKEFENSLNKKPSEYSPNQNIDNIRHALMPRIKDNNYITKSNSQKINEELDRILDISGDEIFFNFGPKIKIKTEYQIYDIEGSSVEERAIEYTIRNYSDLFETDLDSSYFKLLRFINLELPEKESIKTHYYRKKIIQIIYEEEDRCFVKFFYYLRVLRGLNDIYKNRYQKKNYLLQQISNLITKIETYRE